jgi:hypothetical protein
MATETSAGFIASGSVTRTTRWAIAGSWNRQIRLKQAKNDAAHRDKRWFLLVRLVFKAFSLATEIVSLILASHPWKYHLKIIGVLMRFHFSALSRRNFSSQPTTLELEMLSSKSWLQKRRGICRGGWSPEQKSVRLAVTRMYIRRSIGALGAMVRSVRCASSTQLSSRFFALSQIVGMHKLRDSKWQQERSGKEI